MNDKMKVEWWDVSRVVPYEHNPRDNDAAVEPLANSIREFGWKQPIVVDSDGVIIAGHTRLKAANLLGMEKVPVLVASDLTPAQCAAYRLADNKTAELASWDMGALAVELDGLAVDFDMGEFGFDSSDFGLPKTLDDVQEVEVPEEAPAVCKRGDVWQLGEHRLMCGDSTDADDVAKLMGGGHADVCFTSPPYNMSRNNNYESAPNPAMLNSRAYKEYEDSLSDEEYADMLCNSLGNALQYADDAMFNVGVLVGSKRGIAETLGRFKDAFSEIVVWNKSQSMPYGMPNQHGMLSHRCEMVFCFNNRGNRVFSHPQWGNGQGINRIDTVNASGNEYAKEHAATFPVEFAAEVVRNFTETSVLDLFGGTGTTLIAAEQLGRKCYMMELDPHYCDVIIKRWEDFTGKRAEKVN